MKLVGIRQAQQQLCALLDTAQSEPIVITRHGRPIAIVNGVAGLELTDVIVEHDPDFWKLIEERRRSRKPLVSLASLSARPARRAKGR